MTLVNKRNHILSRYYNSDTLYFYDYVGQFRRTKGYVNVIGNTDKQIIPHISDTLFNYFLESLIKTGIPIQFADTFANHHESTLDSLLYRNIKKQSNARYLKIAKERNANNKTYLIPYIDVFSGAGIVNVAAYGPSSIKKAYIITIIIYLIRNDNIIYLRKARLQLEPSYHASWDEEPVHKITQEDFDRIVGFMMKDYIKRLK
jgi:hypothetical protein